jgi:vacuolar-type H+-ATPase subunit E/Vma4
MNTKSNDLPYDFLVLGTQVSDALTRAAEHQLAAAQKLLEDTQALADGIRHEVEEHARKMAAQHDRLTAFGKQILDAHNTYADPSAIISDEPDEKEPE